MAPATVTPATTASTSQQPQWPTNMAAEDFPYIPSIPLHFLGHTPLIIDSIHLSHYPPPPFHLFKSFVLSCALLSIVCHTFIAKLLYTLPTFMDCVLDFLLGLCSINLPPAMFCYRMPHLDMDVPGKCSFSVAAAQGRLLGEHHHQIMNLERCVAQLTIAIPQHCTPRYVWGKSHSL